jgi:putative spermidine/putrescine transport system permease protein
VEAEVKTLGAAASSFSFERLGAALRSLRGIGLKEFLALPSIVIVVAVFLIPIFVLLLLSAFDPLPTLEHFERLFLSRAYKAIFLNTLSVAALVTLVCLLLGYPFAAFLISRPKDERQLWLFLTLVPMWMSVLIRSYAWMVLLGRQGIVNRGLVAIGIIEQPIQLLFTSGAVYVAMVQILLPMMIVTCYASMTLIDLELMKAARILGASATSAFRYVFLPLSLRGAVNGSVVVFVLSLGFFATPALLGGRRNGMVSNVISLLITENDWSFAAVLSFVLLAITLVILGLVSLATRSFPSVEQ